MITVIIILLSVTVIVIDQDRYGRDVFAGPLATYCGSLF